MKPILEIKGVSKKFHIHGNSQPYLSLRESLFSFLKPSSKKEEFWALKNITCDVMPGDTLGIIGKNGAGKSTLLKILSKITPPTTGSIVSRGRIASLLEVGTGFHPELSGRENIFMNGSILGMRRAEISKNFDNIVDFSGVGKFIDTPLKHYSSGMQLRLAFAVAAFLENEILIVDEVLAVGDAEFQKKCMGKMEDVSRSGRTVLFVSHNLEALQNICKTALYIKNGEVVVKDDTSRVLERYQKSFILEQSRMVFDRNEAPGNEFFKLLEVAAYNNPDNIEATAFTTDNDIYLKFRFESALKNNEVCDLTYHLFDERGILVCVNTTFFGRQIIKEGENTLINKIPGNILNEGIYKIGMLLFVKDKGNVLYYTRDLVTFTVNPVKTGLIGWQGGKEGVLKLTTEWKQA